MDPRGRRGHKDKILDRFIPPRSLVTAKVEIPGTLLAHMSAADRSTYNVSERKAGILNEQLPSKRRREYCGLLERALLCGETRDRVLPLWFRARVPNGTFEHHKHWPSKARADPLIGAPEIRLYLPSDSISESRSRQRVGWGACGILAAATDDGDVYLWRPAGSSESNFAGIREPLIRRHSDDVDSGEPWPRSLCWSTQPTQPLLVVGAVGRHNSDDSVLQMWNCDEKKMVTEWRCSSGGSIVSISWHPYKDVIAVGTSRGSVLLLTSSLVPLRSPVPFCELTSVACTAFSPDGTLLACGGGASGVKVWAWESDGEEFVATKSTVTSLSWHPWRQGVLAVGMLVGSIVILYLPHHRGGGIGASYGLECGAPSLRVTAMMFSPRTAELVAAFSHRGASQVVVLSDLGTAVDRIVEHTKAVSSLCWNPGGTLLATAGLDEKLCVWNFLGALATRQVAKQKFQQARERRSGVRRQFGCVIR